MKRPKSAGWYVIGLLATANFLHYANRNVVLTMYDDLERLFNFSTSSLGLLTTVYMLAHAPATVVLGGLSDRVDRRFVLFFGILVWSVASLCCMVASGVTEVLVSRAFVGLGTGACVPVANAMICDYVPREQKARAVSIFNLGLFLGGGCGLFLGDQIGFPMAFVVVGAPGLGIMLLIATIRLHSISPPSHRAASSIGLNRSGGELGAPILMLLKRVTFRWTVVGAVLMAFAVGAYMAWFFYYLQHNKGASEGQALTIFGVSLVAGLAGVITGGAIADRLKMRFVFGRHATIAIGMVLSVPMALLVIYLPLGTLFYVCSSFLMFFINWYHGPLVASVDDMVPRDQAGLAQGAYISAMHLLGTAPAPWLVGLVAGRVGFQTALLIPTGAMFLAAVCFAVIARNVGGRESA